MRPRLTEILPISHEQILSLGFAAALRSYGCISFGSAHGSSINDLPGVPHFDPFPFTFLTLVVSLEAIFLSAFILISQNHETRLSERRNQLDLQINLLTEQENTKMLKLLEPNAIVLQGAAN